MESYTIFDHSNNSCHSAATNDYYLGRNLIDAISIYSYNVKNSDFKKCLEELREYTSKPKSIGKNYKEIIKIILSNLKNSSIENYQIIIELLVAFIGDLRQRVIPILSHLIEFLRILILESNVIKCDYKKQLFHIFTYLNEWPMDNFESFHRLFEAWLTSSSSILQSHSSYIIGTTMKKFNDELYKHSIIYFVHYSKNLSNADIYYKYIDSIGLAIAYLLYNSNSNLFWRADQLIRLGLSIYEDNSLNISSNDDLLNNELFINSLFTIYLNAFYHLKCMNAPIDILIKMFISEIQKYIINITRGLGVEDTGNSCKKFDFKCNKLSIAFGIFVRSSIYHSTIMASFFTNSLLGLIYWAKPISDVDIIMPIELSLDSLFDLKSLNNRHLMVIYNNILLPNFEFLCDIISNLSRSNPGKYSDIIQLSSRLFKKLVINMTQSYNLFDSLESKCMLIHYTNRSNNGLYKIAAVGKKYPECIDLIHKLLKSLNNLGGDNIKQHLELKYSSLNILNDFNKLQLCESNIIQIYNFLVPDFLDYLDDFITNFINSDLSIHGGLIMASITSLLDCILTFLRHNIFIKNMNRFKDNLISLFKISISYLISDHNDDKFDDVVISNAIKSIDIIFRSIPTFCNFDTSEIEETIQEVSDKLQFENQPFKCILDHCTIINSKMLVFAIYLVTSSKYKFQSGIYEYLSHNKFIIEQLISTHHIKKFIIQFYKTIITRLIIPNRSVQLLILDCIDYKILHCLNKLFKNDCNEVKTDVRCDDILEKLRRLISIDYSINDQRAKVNLTVNIIDNSATWSPLVCIIVMNVLTSQLLYKFEPLWNSSIESISKLIRSYKSNVATVYDCNFFHHFYNLYSSFIKSYIQHTIGNHAIYLDDTKFSNEANSNSIPIYNNDSNYNFKISNGNINNIFDLIKSYDTLIDNDYKKTAYITFSKEIYDRNKRKPLLYIIESKLYSFTPLPQNSSSSIHIDVFTDANIVVKNFSLIVSSIINKLGVSRDKMYYHFINELVDMIKKLFELKCYELIGELINAINSIVPSKIKVFDSGLDNQVNKSILYLSVLIINNFTALNANVKEKCIILLSHSIRLKESFPNLNSIISLINGKEIKSTIEYLSNFTSNGQMIVFNKILYKILFQLTMRFNKSFKSDRFVIIDFLNSSPESILPRVYYELFESIIYIKDCNELAECWDDVIRSICDDHEKFFQILNPYNWNNGLVSWNPCSINSNDGGYDMDKLGEWFVSSTKFTININFVTSIGFNKFVKWLDRSISQLSILLKPIHTFLFQLLYDCFLIYSSLNKSFHSSQYSNLITNDQTNDSVANKINGLLDAVMELDYIKHPSKHSYDNTNDQSFTNESEIDLFDRPNFDVTCSADSSEYSMIDVDENQKNVEEMTIYVSDNINNLESENDIAKGCDDDNFQSKKEINLIKFTLLNLLIKLIVESTPINMNVSSIVDMIKDSLTNIVKHELNMYVRHSNKISCQIITLLSSICTRSIQSKDFIYTTMDVLAKSFEYQNGCQIQTYSILSECMQLTLELFTNLYSNSENGLDLKYLEHFIQSTKYYWYRNCQLSNIQLDFISMAIQFVEKYADFLFLVLLTSKNISKLNQRSQDTKALNNALKMVIRSMRLINNMPNHENELLNDIIYESDNLTTNYLANCRDLKARKYTCEIMSLTAICELSQSKMDLPFNSIFKNGYNEADFEIICKICTSDYRYWRYGMACILDTLYCIKSGTLIIKINIDDNINFLSDFTAKFICETKISGTRTTKINTLLISSFIKPLLSNIYFLMTSNCDWLEDYIVLVKSIGLFYTGLVEKACALYCLGNGLQAEEGVNLLRMLFPLSNAVELLIMRAQQFTITTAIEIVKRLSFSIKKYKTIIANDLSANDRAQKFDEMTNVLFGDISDTLPQIINLGVSENMIDFDGKFVYYGEETHSHYIYDFDDIKRNKHALALKKMGQCVPMLSHVTLVKFAIPLALHYLKQPNSSQKTFSDSLADAAGDFLTSTIAHHLTLKHLIPSLFNLYNTTRQNRIFRIMVNGISQYKFELGDGNDVFLGKLLKNVRSNVVVSSKFYTRGKRDISGEPIFANRNFQKTDENRICVPGACELYGIICNLLDILYENDVVEDVMWVVRRLGNMLKSRDRDIRRSARNGLVKLACHINIRHLPNILYELDLLLQTGYKVPVLSFTSLKILEGFTSHTSDNAYLIRNQISEECLKVIFRIISKELMYILDSNVLEKGIGDVKSFNRVDEGKRQHFADICYILSRQGDTCIAGRLYLYYFEMMLEHGKHSKFLVKLKEMLTATAKGLSCRVDNDLLNLSNVLLWISISYIHGHGGSCLVDNIDRYLSNKPTISESFDGIIYQEEKIQNVYPQVVKEFYIHLASSALEIMRAYLRSHGCTGSSSVSIDIIPVVYTFTCGNSLLQDKSSRCIMVLLRINVGILSEHCWVITRVIFEYFSRIQCHRDIRNNHILLLKIFVNMIDQRGQNWLRAIGISDHDEARKKIYNTLIDVCINNMSTSSMRISMLQVMHYLFMKNSISMLATQSKVTNCVTSVTKLLLHTQCYTTQVFRHGSKILLYILKHYPTEVMLDSLMPLLVKNVNVNRHVVFALLKSIIKCPTYPPQSQYTRLIFFICYSSLSSVSNAVSDAGLKGIVYDIMTTVFRLVPNQSVELLDTCYK